MKKWMLGSLVILLSGICCLISRVAQLGMDFTVILDFTMSLSASNQSPWVGIPFHPLYAMSMPPQDLYHRNENSENLKDQGHDSHPPLPPMGPHVKKRRDTKSDRDSQLCDSVKMMNHLIHVDLVKLMWDLRNDIQ